MERTGIENSLPTHDLTILAVADLQASVSFYRTAFGWPTRIEVPVFVEYGVVEPVERPRRVEVHLADELRVIPGARQHAGQRVRVVAAHAGLPRAHAEDAGVPGGLTGHEDGPGRDARRHRGVGASEVDAIGGEAVEVRRPDDRMTGCPEHPRQSPRCWSVMMMITFGGGFFSGMGRSPLGAAAIAPPLGITLADARPAFANTHEGTLEEEVDGLEYVFNAGDLALVSVVATTSTPRPPASFRGEVV